MRLIKLFLFMILAVASAAADDRQENDFGKGWRFIQQDIKHGQEPLLDDSQWRLLNLPHDWSIEGSFSKDHPAGTGGGALPGGIGWYRKTFTLSQNLQDKLIFIDFDGVYRNSEVWINGHYLGKRPYGYITFRYELTPYINWKDKNVIAVKVDNSLQPNSRWYTGSGIYRNVHLVSVNKIYVDQWGTFITTPDVSKEESSVNIKTTVVNREHDRKNITLITTIFDNTGTVAARASKDFEIAAGSVVEVNQDLNVRNPKRWSVESPYIYYAVSKVLTGKSITDIYSTSFGIRTFNFDPEKGFSLNGERLKIKGVCLHHDLGALGAAVNKRAIERQLEIMKKMGVNAIRTSHNPPARELLDLTDRMGFIVMNEAFDVWSIKKTDFDYALDWNEWYKTDLEDFVKRDRNHPSVFMWSIGNELMEQYDKSNPAGTNIANELASIVKSLDPTRAVTAALNDPDTLNPVIRAGNIDVIGYNYHHDYYSFFRETYPAKAFIASETTSALATRGYYDLPSDSTRIWPDRWDIPLTDGNPDNTCSSYDNCHVPWGATHEDALKAVKKNDFVSGMFIWTGFDYLGEPTPYQWPSRSSYFGIVDLCGFPKDAYYLYQSEWTEEPVLHIFPHWNWKEGDNIDVWCYTNIEEVELLLNGISLGIKKKSNDQMHIAWSVKYTPGILKAIGKKNGKEVLSKEIKTAGAPAKLLLEPDRNMLSADGKDLCFVTVKILDKDSNLVPMADNHVNFEISGNGAIAAVDNGLQTSMESFRENFRKAFNGMCLAVIRADETGGIIKLKATSPGLEEAEITISSEPRVSSK